jgi:hypothetical protein
MRGNKKDRMWLVVHLADVKVYKSTARSARRPRNQRPNEIKLLYARLGHPGKHMELRKVINGLGNHVFCPHSARAVPWER